MPADLTGLPILITGASSGIGLATAFACAKAGMPVALTARRKDRLTAAADKIKAAGGRAVALRCDVTNPDECRFVLSRATEELGHLHAVFANAGYGVESPVHLMDEMDMRELFETNFFGSLNIIRPAVTEMLARKSGHILWCSSGLSKITLPNFAAYSASKAMQDHFGRAMRLELRGTGVISSTVHPISTESEFAKVVEERGGDARRVRTPKGMRQTAEHVANCIVRCLRHPRGEVWPSLPARLLLGVATAFPQFADWVISRQQQRLDEGREG